MKIKANKAVIFICSLVSILICVIFVACNFNNVCNQGAVFDDIEMVAEIRDSNEIFINNRQQITLEEDVRFVWEYDCNLTAVHVFYIAYSQVNTKFDVKVKDLNSTEEIAVQNLEGGLPSYAQIPDKTQVASFKLEKGKRYEISVFYTNVGTGYTDIEVSLTLWKEFKKISIGDVTILDERGCKGEVHLVAGQEYELNIEYRYGDGQLISNEIYLNDTMKESVTFKGNLNMYVNEASIGKTGTITMLDYKKIYTFAIRIFAEPYDIGYEFNRTTYEITLKYKDTYGNPLQETFIKEIDINFGGYKKIYYNAHDKISIIDFPVFKDKETLTISILVKYNNKTIAQKCEPIVVETIKEDVSTFTDSAFGIQRLILTNKDRVNNKAIRFSKEVKVVVFDFQGEYDNLSFEFNLSQECLVFVNSISLKGDKTLIKSTAPNLKLNISGANSISGRSNTALIDARGIEFEGDGKLNVTGLDGVSGSNGVNGNIDGKNGTNGTNAIICTHIKTSGSAAISLKAGNGGNGGNGMSFTSGGLKGGNGGNGGHAGISCTEKVPGIEYIDGKAGRGGNGGNGGKGNDGKNAEIAISPNGISYTNIVRASSAGGTGGAGGNAGKNGEGELLNPNDLPKGGNGGEGGKGGDGASGLLYASTNPATGAIKYTNGVQPASAGGVGGAGGAGYVGGTGGTGGTGGKGYNGNAAIWLGPSGSDGGNGGSGGAGGQGGDSWYNATYAGEGGIGGIGGAGGAAGSGIFATYKPGTSGAKGNNGRNGTFKP